MVTLKSRPEGGERKRVITYPETEEKEIASARTPRQECLPTVAVGEPE